MHPPLTRAFERILIIKPSSFGDVIHALPVLNGIRRRYPHARISWLVATSCAGLLEDHPALDEVIRFDRRRFGGLGRDLQVSVEFVHFVGALRARRFDLVVDLQGLFRSGFLAFASGAPVRVGFAAAREFAPLFYTHRVTDGGAVHAVDRNYRVARLLGFEDVPVTFELPVRPGARERVAVMLAESGLPPGGAYVVIAPGARWETKIWPADRFAALARRIVAELGCHVVLVGMESEKPIADRVASEAGEMAGGIINLAGRTGLAELIALVDGAAAAVMHDSGPMHLATALGRPMIALYGPTNPRLTGPYARPEAVARLELDCSPCYFKRLTQCPHGHRCLRDLSANTIFDRLAALLGAHAEAAR